MATAVVGLLAVTLVGCDTTSTPDAPASSPTPSEHSGGWQEVAADHNRTCGIKTDHTLWCWGAPDTETDTEADKADGKPRPIGAGAIWEHVEVGAGHACAIRTDGSLWCWGNNQYGQLGDGSTKPAKSPARVGHSRAWVSVSVAGSQWGASRTCAVTKNGALWCWGGADKATLSLLGLGSVKSAKSPHRVGASDGWTSVSVGDTHACAVRDDHTLWCWGSNMSGELGDGTTSHRVVPVRVGPGNGWADVSAGLTSTCATKTSGTLWCWGNAYGPLGFRASTDVRAPRQVGDSRGWSQVATSEFHACATTHGGRLFCWVVSDPENPRFESSIHSLTPRRMPNSAGWDSVSLGDLHTCALRANGSLWCWGYNNLGQLGAGLPSPDNTSDAFSDRPLRVPA
jgi:alpha-tubulin suppressor-like RCC1 family protein